MIKETPKQAANRFVATLLSKGFVKQALHEYQTKEGKTIYWRIRLKHPDKNEKWIRPMHCNEQGEFVLGEPTFSNKKPLYQLPNIVADLQKDIWIVEGEYCVDKLIKLGLVATTSGGKESVASTDWSPLANRRVIIWPDNDKAGSEYAKNIILEIKKLNCEILVVDIKQLELSEKGDCVDWLGTNMAATIKDIEALPLEKIPPEQKLPLGFRIDESGVYYTEYQEDGEVEYWLCSKLEVTALVRDVDSENWSKLLEFCDSDQHPHSWVMQNALLAGDAKIIFAELHRLGLEITSNRKAQNFLKIYLNDVTPSVRARFVNRTGWYNHVFVLPNQIIGQTSEKIIYECENPARHYQQKGTLEDWQKHIAGLCKGNSRLILAISTAFAAMLLPIVGIESGGLHLVGGSSTGKTTALRVAASVYGGPSYLNRWRTTINGLEALATLHSDTLLILDELAQVESKEAGESAYLLANGSGKTRANKLGEAKRRYEWRILFLSAGEIGLAQHMCEAGKKVKAGQAVRLVDVSADAGANLGLFENLHGMESGVALSQVLMEATMQYYGVAAITFLQALTDTKNFVAAPFILKTLQQQFIKDNLPPQAGSQVCRVCERFALIAAAGELATHDEISGWEDGEATQGVQQCFQSWLMHRGHTGNQERMNILTQVQAFFEAHGASRFEDLQAANDQRIINRVGFKRINESGAKEYLVLPEMFRQEICKGLDLKLAIQVLTEAKMLKLSSEGKPLTPHRIANEGVKKCYHFVCTESDER